MRALFTAVLAAALLLAPSVCHADDDDTPPRDPPKPNGVWYGYQTLATDGVALALFVSATQAGGSQQGLGTASVLTFGLGAPIVHLVHGHADKAFGDLALRILLPLGTAVLGGFAGAAGLAASHPTCHGDPGSCNFDGIATLVDSIEVGGLLGMAGAAIIDASVLAREHVDNNGPVAGARPGSEPRPSTARIEPSFGVTPERQGGARATLGVIGTF